MTASFWREGARYLFFFVFLAAWILVLSWFRQTAFPKPHSIPQTEAIDAHSSL